MAKNAINKILFLILFLFATSVSMAQLDDLTNAIKSFQEGKLDVAKTYIDKATVNSSDPWAWYFKGFLYKEIYKAKEKGNKSSPAREESVKAFKKSLALDKKKEHEKSNIENVKYLSISYMNDAVDAMNSALFDQAVVNYEKYKETILITDPSIDIKKKNIEFYMALSSAYATKYETGGAADNLEKAKNALQKVLSIDPNYAKANYELAVLYYNQAVKLIKNMDYDADLVALSQIQDASVVLFKASLPFMEKAYNLDPKQEDAVEGLSGIYFSLNDQDKSQLYQNKLNEMRKK